MDQHKMLVDQQHVDGSTQEQQHFDGSTQDQHTMMMDQHRILIDENKMLMDQQTVGGSTADDIPFNNKTASGWRYKIVKNASTWELFIWETSAWVSYAETTTIGFTGDIYFVMTSASNRAFNLTVDDVYITSEDYSTEIPI